MRVPAASSNQPFDSGERASPGSLFRVWPMMAVAAGGALGGVVRSALAEIDAGWPWPTLVVNLTGAFLLGVSVMYGRRHWSPVVMAGVSVGLLGAFTTFSALAGELWDLQDSRDWEALASYGAASVAGGAVAAVAGVRTGRMLR